ncbi:MAG: DUF4062 domain-containing protein [Candidatus Promineifilaceae bacterium]|nr:DUF4062 domain-containing protein [Candidatus Promineifilaceae bacterium]
MFVIFICSTWHDLQSEHQALEHNLRSMPIDPQVGIEVMSSLPDTATDQDLARIETCHVYLLIVARCYGTGIIEAGYRKTRQKDIPCLVYFRDDAVPVLPRHIEQDSNNRVRLEAFKQELRENHSVSTFETSEQLVEIVRADLGALLEERNQSRTAASIPHIYVSGDLIMGDKTGGDKFNVENIAGSNLAIGQSSSVTAGTGRSSSASNRELGIPEDEIIKLHQQLVEQFSVEELHTLCFQLGYDYEEIGGVGKSAKARELIIFVQRRKQLDRLQEAVKRLRG